LWLVNTPNAHHFI